MLIFIIPLLKSLREPKLIQDWLGSNAEKKEKSVQRNKTNFDLIKSFILDNENLTKPDYPPFSGPSRARRSCCDGESVQSPSRIYLRN